MDSMTRTSELPCDGERFIPTKMGGVIALEHWHRYLFAAQFVADKEVLDIASGEGYGSARLARVARTVVGVDIAPDAVEHARAAYKLNNLEYVVGKCEAIPLRNHSFDVVVSFETIEHFEDHRAMMLEIKRVLRPDGLLIISSPDKLEYSDTPGYSNPFHLKELYGHEFKEILAGSFGKIAIYGQRVLSGSVIEGESANGSINYFDIDNLDSSKANCLTKPLYFIALASDRDLPKSSVSILEKDFQALYTELGDYRNSGMTKVIHAIARRDSAVLNDALQSDWYLERNIDLIHEQVDPVAHWFATGAAEGRIPSSDPTQMVSKLLNELMHSTKAEVALLLEEIEKMRSEQPIDLRNLEAEMARAKLRARYEIEAMARQMLQREEVSRTQILKLQREAEAGRTELRLAARRDLEASTQRQLEREGQLRTEFAQRENELRSLHQEALDRQQAQANELSRVRLEARKELEVLLHKLTEREQAFSDQISQLRQEAETKQTELEQAARLELAASIQRQLEREEQLRTEFAQRENEFRRLQQQALDRQQLQENELSRVRLDARRELEVLLHKLAEREQAFSDQIRQFQERAAASQNSLRNEHKLELEKLALQRADQEQLLRTELEHTRQAFRSYQQNSESEMFALKASLDSIFSTRSWRWTSPFRSFLKILLTRQIDVI